MVVPNPRDLSSDKEHLTYSIKVLDESIEKWLDIHSKITQSPQASSPAVQNELRIIEAKISDWRKKRETLVALLVSSLR